MFGSWYDNVALHESGKVEAVRLRRIC